MTSPREKISATTSQPGLFGLRTPEGLRASRPLRTGRWALLATGAGMTAAGAVILFLGSTEVFVAEDLAFMNVTRAMLDRVKPRFSRSVEATMIAKHAALFVALAGVALDAQTIPQRLAQGEPVEICGRVTSFVSGVPAHCDASVEVKTVDGHSTTVVIPASARLGTSGGRELLDAEACFAGQLELAEAVTRVRVPSFASIRVTRPSPRQPFGPAVVDACAVGGIDSPRIVREVKPRYTSAAMRARVEGAVIMDAIVSADGNVTNIRVTQPLDPELDQQAVKALREWKFAPGTRNGQPVAVIVSVEMTFRLRTRR